MNSPQGLFFFICNNYILGAYGPNNTTESWRIGSEYKGWVRAQTAHTDIQDIQGPGGGSDRTTVRRGRRH